jgi:hypothetical protein
MILLTKMKKIMIMNDEVKKERVSEKYPFGGITDGTYVCGRCGESVTGCALCAGELVSFSTGKK